MSSVVKELGIANTAIGTIGMGAIFYGLAGVNHVAHKNRNFNRQVALASDLFVAAVLAVCIVWR